MYTKIIPNNYEKGAAWDRNKQIREAKNDILLFLDSDARTSKEPVELMEKELENADITYPIIYHVQFDLLYRGRLLDSTCFMMRKSTILKHDLWFDEKMIVYGEDTDFFLRCYLNGLKTKMINKPVLHAGHFDEKYWKRRKYLECKNALYLLRKHRKVNKKVKQMYGVTWQRFFYAFKEMILNGL